MTDREVSTLSPGALSLVELKESGPGVVKPLKTLFLI